MHALADLRLALTPRAALTRTAMADEPNDFATLVGERWPAAGKHVAELVLQTGYGFSFCDVPDQDVAGFLHNVSLHFPDIDTQVLEGLAVQSRADGACCEDVVEESAAAEVRHSLAQLHITQLLTRPAWYRRPRASSKMMRTAAYLTHVHGRYAHHAIPTRRCAVRAATPTSRAVHATPRFRAPRARCKPSSCARLDR
jgi:hypothetical protein